MGEGCSGVCENGTVNVEKSVWSKEKESSVAIFDNIDIKNGTARLIGNAGAVDVGVFADNSGFTFVERASGGNNIFTTVFPYIDPTNYKC